jgi:glycosyltransferase involved in cell wall biosynthesis
MIGMKSDLISVVMPVYNVESYIDAAITSILLQSHSNLEIVVVDGGSTDGTLQRLARISDPRLRLVDVGGECQFLPSLNVGIRAAHGDWIVRMDGDDICHPYRLERQLAFLKANSGASFVGTRSGYLSPAGRLVCRKTTALLGIQKITTYSITAGAVSYTDGSMMFPRQLALDVGLYDEKFPRKETPLWYRLLSSGPGYAIGVCDYWIRIREGSLTYQHMMADTTWQAVREHYDPDGFRQAFPDPTPPSPAQARINNHSTNLAICVAAHDWSAAIKQAVLACQYDPLNVMLYRKIILTLLKRESLHFWKRPWNRTASDYYLFVPEDDSVAEALSKMGAKLSR